MDMPQFNHSLTEGNLGCFQCGDIMNKTVINIGVQVSVWMFPSVCNKCVRIAQSF